MSAFHQMGHDSKNLLDQEELSGFAGAVLSPVNYNPDDSMSIVERLRVARPGDFKLILDPQLYYPRHVDRGYLSQWSYFPKDFDSADRGSADYWNEMALSVAKAGHTVRAHMVASPADVPGAYDDPYYVKLVESGTALANAADFRFEPMQSAIVHLRELADQKRVLTIASIVSETPCRWIYLMVETGERPRRELTDAAGLCGLMQLIASLEAAKRSVFVAYSSSDVLLWKAAGASACSTGKYFNVRRFTKSRFEEKIDGGGVTEYWFEESLLSFIREGDLVRLKHEQLLSEATLKNPFFALVMSAIEEPAGPRAWIALSWRQFLFWFADIERRLSANPGLVEGILRDAIAQWVKLSDEGVIMHDPTNNGEWTTRWLQALLDFKKRQRDKS